MSSEASSERVGRGGRMGGRVEGGSGEVEAAAASCEDELVVDIEDGGPGMIGTTVVDECLVTEAGSL